MRNLLGLGFLFAVSSCGKVDNNNVSTLDDFLTSSRYDSIDWYFPCPFDAPNEPNKLVVPNQTNPRKIILNGVGPFEYVKEDMAHIPVTVHGRVCPWKLVHRDVTFVIDVSGSMATSDPKVEIPPAGSGKKTCGRLDALNAILDKMPANITSFAVVTYDDTLVKKSSKLFKTKAELFADLVGTTAPAPKIEEIICADGMGTTYTAGLTGAKQVLEKGEVNATKEIIFLSDGAPYDGPQAKTMANDLKTNGVTVGGRKQTVSLATVFLGTTVPNPNILEEMASVDKSKIPPKPIYAVAKDAAELADLLGKMIENNKLQGSDVIQGGDSASSSRTTIDVFQKLDAKNQFVTVPFELKLDRAQANYILNFEYWDTMQNRSSYPGTIHWK